MLEAQRKRSKWAGLAAGAAVGSLAMVPVGLTAMPAGAASAPVYGYQGTAYGTTVTAAGILKSGPTAPVYLGCTSKAGIDKTNTTASTNLGAVGHTGTTVDRAQTSTGPVATTMSSDIQNVGLLGGVVSADAVHVTSRTSYAGGSFTTAGTTTFLNLRVAGVSVTANPGRNSTLNLAGLGTVTLNEQFGSNTPRGASLTVNGIHIRITKTNALHIPVGANIVVAHATSALTPPTAGLLDGHAYSTSLKVGSLVKSGPSALIVMPCQGTNGRLRTNSTAAVTIPQVLVTGAASNTVRGSESTSSAMGETTSKVAAVNLLSSLVRANVITADAHAATNGTTKTFSTAGSSFVGLHVAGFTRINDSVAINTQLTIRGVGTLYLHRVLKTANSIEVRMVELVVTTARPGLPVGADLRIAVAEASVH